MLQNQQLNETNFFRRNFRNSKMRRKTQEIEIEAPINAIQTFYENVLEVMASHEDAGKYTRALTFAFRVMLRF